MIRIDLKVVLLGPAKVGKTSLAQRFVNEKFNEHMSYQNTIGVAFTSKQIQINNDQSIVMGLWDTAGSERYKATSKIYYRGASAAVICYDVIDRDSFHDAKSWIQELRSVEEDCKIYLCATKADLLEIGHEASPSLDMVKRYAASVQFKFFLTSSKTGFNVAELFQEIAQDYMLNPKRIVQPAEDLITLNVHTKRSRCCRS